MTPAEYPQETDVLRDICHVFGKRGWCRATSGNFSLRIDGSHCLITQSGKDKSRLAADDLMICDLAGQAIDPACKPSAETPLHVRLYRLDAGIGAVLHTHSVAATLLSRRGGPSLTISGFEMQKAFSGIQSHESAIEVPIFDNDQDMDALADIVTESNCTGSPAATGFLIRGHGLYAWGKDASEARRHVEGFEFLFDCLWQEQLVQQE